jgi:hypothetical protein
MSFNVGDAIAGAVQGFMETGNPYAAAGIGVMSGLEDKNVAQTGLLGQDSIGAGIDPSSAMADYSQFADAFGAA